ncbi:MAG: penicillin-binding protein 2 [Candidatus Eremiobacteraeota bacterium]|nr:penicillin-binding protein 2 [Candidatus Eremiobacteraeota bacterium]
MTPAPARRPAEAAARASEARAKFVFFTFCAIAAVVGVRFFVVQIHDGPKLAHRAYEQHLTTIDYPAHRGSIFDRNGDTLVRSLASRSVYVQTGDVTNVAAMARALAPILVDKSYAELETDLRSKREYIELDHKIGSEQADAIVKLKLGGISIVPESTGMRFVPSGRLASTVVGFTGFDENGLDGIEFEFDSLLRGSPGQMVLEGDQFGRAIPFSQPHVVVAAKPGHSLALTIDSFLQYSAEKVLHDTIAEFHAKSGSVVIMDPQTGEVLALADAPDFDVRDFGRFPADSLRDRAITDAYEPGSTFKLITAAAALESGKVTTEDRFPARDTMQIGGSTIHNAEDGFLAGSSDTETLEDIVVKSHNVGAAEVGLRIGRTTMYDTMKRFGFGDVTDVGLPGENAGIVPRLDDWSATSLPTIAFGHGISTTPLALARAYCAIANGGFLLRPRILSAIVDDDGRVAYRYGREIERRVISARTAATLRRFMRAVVVRGTGNPAAKVPGYTTAGKTGTAQVAENGYYASGKYVASFVGFVPAEVPRFVILVKIAEPQGAIYGGVVAAPAFAKLAKISMLHAGILPAGPRLVRASIASKHHS